MALFNLFKKPENRPKDVQIKELKTRIKTLEQSETKQEKEKRLNKNPLISDSYIQKKQFSKSPLRLVIDTMKTGIEADYFWILRFMRSKYPHGLHCDEDQGRVEKITDIYQASEASSYWGSQEQKRAAQIDKFTQIMQGISGMLKSTFQILRELRIIDERLDYYKGYNEKNDSASVALKSVWVDMVEGGSKNPASVIGLAQTVGFTILPDLFYKHHPQTQQDVDKILKILQREKMNRKVREVLGRKLQQFLIWKEKTEKEISTRRNFMLKYLRQHFHAMKLNISWLKPYIRNIKRLGFEDITNNPDLLKSLETSKTEVELIGINYEYPLADPKTGFETTYKFKKYFPAVRVRMEFVAWPQMAFQKEYSRGPIQTGRTIIQFEPYVITEEQLEEYKQEKDREDMEIIASLNESLDSMKEELDHYLEEAGEIVAKPELLKKEPSMTEGILEPFTALGSGIKEIFNIKPKGKKDRLPVSEKQEKKSAAGVAVLKAFVIYDIYKKTHGMYAP